MNEEYKNKWISQLKKGTLPFIVLSVLSRNTYYGYELINEIKKLTDIVVAEGTLYPLLVRLKNENLVSHSWVEQESGIPRKYYLLTEEGKGTLNSMKNYWTYMNNTIQSI